ncbi:MAG TPA: right-handed parallel beta-helix repeat-containing protein [Terriglobales bacterium]|nr:right-handed parallel beta-helix repeat-containing protein [Terriglobales bacterium]
MKNRAISDFARTTLLAATGATKLIATLMLVITGATWVAHAQSVTLFYVATNGNDSWNGKSPTHTSGNNGPFASLAKAQLAVEGVAGTSAVTVQVRGGTYYLPLSPTNPGPLTFGTADSGNAANSIIWENYATEIPVVSGGVPVGAGGLGLTWNKIIIGGKVLWQVQLPSTIQPFEYLFYNDTRRFRARIHDPAGVGYYMSNGSCISTQTGLTVSTSFCNLGTFLRVANSIDPTTDPLGAGCPFSTSGDVPPRHKCLDRFKYSVISGGDSITNWINLKGSYTGTPASPCTPNASNPYPAGDIGLTLIDAWTVDEMRINCVDTNAGEQVIFLICPPGTGGHTCASNGGTASGNGGDNYNFFGPLQNHRYMIENTKDAFLAAEAAGQTGLWFLDRSSSSPVLYYIANAGENPNSATVVLPQLGGQFSGAPATDYIGGSLISATNLSFVTFQNIVFEVDNFVPSYTTGFNNDVNGEMSVPQAIDCESCQHVTFNGVTLQHTSASGILIASSSGTSGTAAQDDVIQNSSFLDMGDSGIRIGHRPTPNDVLGVVVNNVTAQNNLIDGYSRVFPDGEGIAQGNGNHMTYSHNDITDGYHAGISICQITCYGNGTGANGTSITSEYNHLWNMMQGVTSDGGSLYYNIGGANSSGSDDHLLNNLIHDTTDSSIVDTIGGSRIPGTAYGGEGLYLDAQSAGVDVENNVVFHMSGHAIHITEGIGSGQATNLFENNILSLALQGMFTQGKPWPNGCLSGGPQVDLYWNIFNFDQNENPNAPLNSFFVVGGCTNSCGRNYYQFQDFEANAYWRTGTPGTGPLFCSDPNAYQVMSSQPADGSCPAPKDDPLVFLTFDSPSGGAVTWQHGRPPYPPGPPVIMNEDIGEDATTDQGTCSWNPNFGTTGKPSDYHLLNPPPNNPFSVSKTNDTIANAGRTSTGTAPIVPATFPNYSYSNTQF